MAAMGLSKSFPRDLKFAKISKEGVYNMPDHYYVINDTAFVWDADKNEANIKKHKLDFETAALVFNDDLRIEFQDDYEGEERYDTIGLVDDILFVVYCDRIDFKTGGAAVRIISARYATKFEIDLYNNNVLGRR